MVVIAHRGNLNGPNPAQENSPEYIQRAIDAGFDVEIDVWVLNGHVYLGHDHPHYKVTVDFLRNPSFWCHAKNFDALEFMLNESDIHCFWHETDKFTITSEGVIWTYPNNITGQHSVIVTNDPVTSKNIFGVCTDFPFNYTE
jgi:glycerophosphoryl diester phosphodiesterase